MFGEGYIFLTQRYASDSRFTQILIQSVIPYELQSEVQSSNILSQLFRITTCGSGGAKNYIFYITAIQVLTDTLTPNSIQNAAKQSS